MSKYTIAIPHSLYEKAQRLANQTSQSVDDIICTRLEGALDQPMLDLPSDERAELQALSYLSTDALWTIAREQMPPDLQHAMSQLMEEVDPQYGIHRLVRAIKGRSSRLLRQEYAWLKSRLPPLWTNSYFVSTVGDALLEVITQSIENQKRV